MTDRQKPRIKITDGPYLVTGDINLDKQEIVADNEGVSCAWRKVEEYPKQRSYSLCRCGQSKTKPFCDGSHHNAEYQKDEVAKKDGFLEDAQRFEGPRHILLDNYDLCASARFCDRAGSVWELVKHDDGQSSKDLVQECADCPSGRLVAYDGKTHKALEPAFDPSISITEDPTASVSGPIWVKGGVEIESADGKLYENRNRVTLCRCGRSKNMPFCDSSHIEYKFNDEN